MVENAMTAQIRKRIADRGMLDADNDAWIIAKRIGSLLKQKYGAEQVMIFGSLAKKYWTRYSDIDIAERGIPSGLFFKAYLDAEALAGIYTIDLIDLKDCATDDISEIEREGVRV